MILDAVILIGLLIALHYYKSNHPDFLFFPKDAVLFLPPQPKPQSQQKSKKKKEDQAQISILHVKYNDVKDCPFSNEFSRILMTVVGVLIFALIRILISFILEESSMLMFYIIVLISVYMIKLGVEIFFMSSYNRKVCILISFGLNVVFYLLVMVFDGVQGLYDPALSTVVANYSKHLEVIFKRDMSFVTNRAVVGVALFINFFAIILIIPSIIKFGNWYAKILKELYYDDEQSQSGNRLKMPTKINSNNSEQLTIKQKQALLKEESKSTIRILNIYLALMLSLLFLSHRFILSYLEEHLVFFLRFLCLIISSYIITKTMAKAIEFNASFAYRHVLEYFSPETLEDDKPLLRKKIASYVTQIWYHYFQFMIRVFVPVLLFLLIVNWKYLSTNTMITVAHVDQRQFNPDIECRLNLNQLEILSNLYKCSASNRNDLNHVKNELFLSGMLQTTSKDLSPTQIQENINKYGLLTNQFMAQFSEVLFWYVLLSLYGMTVVYILFLRKTVYQL